MDYPGILSEFFRPKAFLKTQFTVGYLRLRSRYVHVHVSKTKESLFISFNH
jgi:hypothetical protein